MHGGHSDHKGKQIVDDCVQEAIEKSSLRHMLHRFKSIVDVQLRTHLDEAKEINAANEGPQSKRVPAFSLIVVGGVNCVAYHERIHDPAEIFHSNCVILFGLSFRVGLSVFDFHKWETTRECNF